MAWMMAVAVLTVPIYRCNLLVAVVVVVVEERRRLMAWTEEVMLQ